MNYSAKHHDSCVRVLEFLKLLAKEDIDIKELDYCKHGKFKDIEAHETFLKYISTLEISNVDVKKISKKYSLCKFLEEITLSDEEINLLFNIYKSFDACCLEKQKDFFENLFTKIEKSLSEPTKRKFLEKVNQFKYFKPSETSKIASEFQQYVDLSQKLSITYNGETFTATPKKVEIKGKNIFLMVYDAKKAENIKLTAKDIEKIEILPLKTASTNMTTSIAFEVYDRLAINYRLRDCETVQTFDDNKKLIINTGEDKKSLFKRLIKYGENCKIVSPKYLEKEMLLELEKIEKKLKGDAE